VQGLSIFGIFEQNAALFSPAAVKERLIVK
jgi:hypothetical protein